MSGERSGKRGQEEVRREVMKEGSMRCQERGQRDQEEVMHAPKASMQAVT